MTHSARETAARVGDHTVVEKGARLGFAVSGLIHLLIAWIAVKVAWGLGSSASADKSGALETVASGSTGPILLWLAVIGFVLLALWQVTEAVVGRHGGEASDRAKAVGKAAMYAFFAYSAFSVSKGSSTSDEQKTDQAAAGLLSSPGGRVLVGLVAVALLAAAGYHVWKGWTKGFVEELERHPGRWAIRSGQAGYVAKGVALAVVGVLFGSAALSSRAAEAGGLDAALKTLRDQPFGPYLLTVVALGLAAAGVWSFVKARHARL